VAGKDHAARLKEVASEFHHSKSPDRSYESILLSDADALDFLGTIGLLRVFSKQTKELKKAYNIVKQKIISCNETLQLDKSKKIAEDRISCMTTILNQF